MPVYHGALRITRVLDSLGDFALLRTPPPHVRRSAFIALAGVLFSAGCGAPPTPQRLSIAAAADLQFALDDISRVFRQAHPEVDVAVTYGSSGNFYSEIRNQAPFDVFLSADI